MPCLQGGGQGRPLDQRREIEHLGLNLGVARLDARRAQHILDQAGERINLAVDQPEILLLRLVIEPKGLLAHEQVGEALDNRERRAELVAGGRDEAAFEAIDLA